MQVIVKVDTNAVPWISAYCPDCKEVVHRTDIMHREVRYCHLCGAKIEFDDYVENLKQAKLF